ncbi:protein Z-dependent protease inhibitor [Stigmatopora nigra]
MDGCLPQHSWIQMASTSKWKMGFFFILMCLVAPGQQASLPLNNIYGLSYNNMDFAMDLYRKISTHHDKNIFFSPLSVSTTFAALSMASDGVTYEEILKGLHLETLEKADQKDFIPKLFQMLHMNISQNGNTTLDQGMALFVHKHFSIEKSFEDQMKSYFSADVNVADFEDTSASVNLINEYIKQKTRGKVTNMISSLDPMTQLMMVNTFYFQGGWQMPFNPNYTYKAPFYVDNYNIRQVPMMSLEDKFQTMEETQLGARLLKLPYLEGVSMLILLPNKGVDYNTIDDEITANKILGWIKRLKHTKLEIHIPKFKMEESYSLHDILPEMGFVSLFGRSANLTKLSKDKGLMVSEVLHKAVIDVDEVGTTAAAATTIGIIPYSLPRTFIVNRPFFFFIYHEDTKSLLFMGRVIDPTKN